MPEFHRFPPIDQEDLDNITRRLSGVAHLLSGANLFITGGTGFLGRCLVESVLELEKTFSLGCSVTILSRDPDAFLNRLPHLKANPHLDFIKGDIRTFDAPKKRMTHILHGAASQDTKLNLNNQLDLFEVIVGGLKRVLDYASSCRPERILTLSTSNIYGTGQVSASPVFEGAALSPDPYSQNAAYIEGKRSAEFLCAHHASRTLTHMPVARIFNQIGPHIPLQPSNVAGDFIKSVLQNRPLVLLSDGSSFRSYMYCTDFAVWILTLLLKGQSKAYHVGGEEGLHLFEMANKIAGQYNLEVQSVCPISRDLHCKGVIPSTRRVFEEFGLTCEVDFMQALGKTVDWYRKAISAGCTVKSSC